MARTKNLKEWIGKNDDAMPTSDVRHRIADRHNWTCHICQGAIDKDKRWDADHVKPLKDGGENRETNLKPAHHICHKKRTAEQAIERAPVERKKLKHSGAARPKGTIKSAPMQVAEKPKKPAGKPSLPPRRLFMRE